MSFDEDRCRIRKQPELQVMASLRNLAISLLRLAPPSHRAALRFCAHGQLRPLRLIGLAERLIPDLNIPDGGSSISPPHTQLSAHLSRAPLAR